MKKLLTSVIGLFFALSAMAAELTVDLGASTNTVLLSGNAAIYTVRIYSTNAANATLSLYDTATAGAAGLTWTQAAFTNIAKSITPVTNVYTTPEGVSVTNITSALTTTYTTYAARTNNRTPIKQVVAVADATTDALVAKYVLTGLSAYCASPLTITVEYEQRP